MFLLECWQNFDDEWGRRLWKCILETHAGDTKYCVFTKNQSNQSQ